MTSRIPTDMVADRTSKAKLSDTLGSMQTSINTNTSSLADIVLNVKSSPFNAKGDGVTDDTSAIQSALNAISSGLRQVYIPDGTYMVNPYTKLKVNSNTKIIFSQNAVLKAINTNQDISSMLDVRNVFNVEIINPTIIGDRDTNTMTTAGAGHGITCIAVTNLIIRGGSISKCFTDGIYLNGITNGLIEFISSDNNRRQGMSITSNIKNLNVRNSSFTNSNGTAPMMGIDIEPNNANDYLSNLRLENIYTSGNIGSGIGVNLNQLDNINTVVDIVIDQWTDNGSTKGLIASKFLGTISETSSIRVQDLKSVNNLDCGIYVAGYKALGNPKLMIIRPRIFNCNINNGTNERAQNVAIGITNESTGYPAGVDHGNIDIIEPEIDMASGRSLLRGIYVYGGSFQRIRIENPRKVNIGGTTLSQNNNNNLVAFNGTNNGNVKVIDRYLSLAITSNYSLIRNFSAGFYSKYTLTATVGTMTLQDWLFWGAVIDPFYVIHNGGTGIVFNVKIPTGIGIGFLDETNTDQQGKTYTASSVGASLKFEKISDTLFKITKMNGTWTVA